VIFAAPIAVVVFIAIKKLYVREKFDRGHLRARLLLSLQQWSLVSPADAVFMRHSAAAHRERATKIDVPEMLGRRQPPAS